MNVEVVILAGGAGTRLWPASDGAHPKQFLSIPENKTLLEQAYERAKVLTDPDHIWIITLEAQVAATLEILPHFSRERILAEPFGRNSAPAITAAAFLIQKIRKEPSVMLVMTADHLIPDTKIYVSTMQKGIERAKEGKSLLTFGLKVTTPQTEYGYIEVAKIPTTENIIPVKKFIEKPTIQKAKIFMKAKKFFWNSGMFVFRSDFFLSEMRKYAFNIYGHLSKAIWEKEGAKLKNVYEKLPNISIDYALMEKSKSVEVVPSSFEWSDVGTWSAAYEAISKDQSENGVVGKGAVIEGKKNLIYSLKKPVYICGVDDLVVVETEHATLVTTREKSLHLKKYLEKIKTPAK